MKPKSINRMAFALLENLKVTSRIEELQAEHRKKHNVTVGSLTADAKEAIVFAKEMGKPSAMVAALTLIAKLHGLLADKKDTTAAAQIIAEALKQRGADLPL
jgi:hypothetical protein